jgi:hypothetical protein
MNTDRNNLPPEPLPADFDAEQVRIDALLGKALRGGDAPAGLSQRVFEMSASSLGAESPQLRLVGEHASKPAAVVIAPARRYTFAAWSRLAMAASVLLAAGITLWAVLPHGTPPAHDVALNKGPTVPSQSTATRNARADDLSDYDHVLAQDTDLDHLEGEVAYLLEASQVRSYDDLNDDLVLLVQQLEM